MKTALRLALTLGLLAAVIWQVAPADLGAALAGLQPGWLALAVAALALQIALSALRWRLTAFALGHDLSRDWAMREYGLSVAANSFLPGGVLGDAARIARSRHLGWGDAAGSVLIERLAGQVALAALVPLSLALWLGAGVAASAALGGLVLCLVLLRLFPAGARLLARAWLGPGIWHAQAALTLAILAVNIGGFWAAALAVGITLTPTMALALLPPVLLAMLIPLTVNGWGIREGVAAALWPAFGISAAQAVAASMAYGLACMGAALLGLLPWLMTRAEGARQA